MKKRLLLIVQVLLLGLGASAADRRIVLLAGSVSHGRGEHEFRAGCLALKHCLDQVKGVTSVVYTNGWPQNADAFVGADAVFMYADGGGGHPAIKPDRLKILNDLARKGVGIGCAHYAVEVPKGDAGDAMLEWTGGSFETFWSVNPHWDAEFSSLPKHPVTRGVQPFKINDEWYYHMRFREGMRGVTPILSALPPAKTLNREDGPHSGNPGVRSAVAKGEPQHLMWVAERPGGGRGFGFTGGHFHRNWADENFRRVVLNGILWIAKKEVPRNGVQSVLTAEQLAVNLDDKKK